MTQVTKAMLADVAIIASPKRDAGRPTLCAVARVLPRGREILADELEDKRAAERWIEAHRTMAPER